MKRCSTCREWKRLDEYHRAPKNPDGHDSRCKVCACAYQHRRYEQGLAHAADIANARVKDARKAARKAGAAINDLTVEQWRWLVFLYGGYCAYCGRQPKRIGLDHVVPLSRGGNNTLSNVVPVCRSCNSHKHAKTPVEAHMTFAIRPLATGGL